MRFHHYGLEVNNMEESVDIYKKQLGLQEESRMFFMGEEIVFLVLGDFRLELISSEKATGHTTHICFEVSDLQEVMGLLFLHRRVEGPYKLQNGWETVFYEGPDQEMIEFLQASPKQ